MVPEEIITINPKRTKTINSWPKSTDVTEVQAFSF